VPLLWLLGIQAATGWSPPAQAAWSGDTPPIEAHLHADTLSMHGTAPIEVDLVATGDGFAVSPFLQATRGIAFEVTSEAGQPVSSVAPMVISPPPPPLETEKLVQVSRASPFHVQTRESARTIFPGPGKYKVRARLFFLSYPSRPVRYAQIVSNTILVNVTN
jgi:hypothetical protein